MFDVGSLVTVLFWIVGVVVVVFVVLKVLGVRVIRSDAVGVVEKWWSPQGSQKDSIIAMKGEAGYQPEVLRGGIHFRSPFMYRVRVMPLITIPQGKIGYVFARDGIPMQPQQTLARVVECGNFQDVRGFFADGGQRGPQRAIMREGTYALNLAQFMVITESHVYYLPMGTKEEESTVMSMASHLASVGGFAPVLITGAEDKVGIVTVQDGPSLPMGDIIAPPVGDEAGGPNYHNNFQNPEAFLSGGGYRGRQYQVLTEGTYFINRLFATVEMLDKTIVPVGYAGVVVSYYGPKGADISGEDYRHGELVTSGFRGVWSEPLMPGKYAFNLFAGKVILVPTTNIILKWIKGETGAHNFDANLTEIGLITKDAFEPSLPLSVVIHIDYKKAPLVIQRFGDISMLVNQTLDPMVSSYFKNVGQTKTLIELLQQRNEIQAKSSDDMKERFNRYNLELEEVLIGTPRSPEGDTRIETILTQLRDRQIAFEKLETFDKQKIAADKERELKEAMAVAEQQTMLTQSEINIKVQENQGRAELQRAAQDAERVKTLARGDAEKVKTLAAGEAEKVKLMAGAEQARVKMLADAEATKIRVTAEADADREARVGIGRAIAIEEQVNAYGGPQLQLAQDVMTKLAQAVETSKVPIVPQTVVNMGGGEGNDSGAGNNAFGLLLALLTSEKLGAPIVPGAAESKRSPEVAALRRSVMEGATKVPENTGTGVTTAAAPVPAKAPKPATRPMDTPSLPDTHPKSEDAEDTPEA
jgi:uncharacterized membrane protein YqiK